MHTIATKELAYNIEEIWSFLNDDQVIKKLDPKVILNEPVELKEGVIGSTYRQVYKERKKEIEYIITTTDYADEKGLKRLGFEFTLGKSVQIKAKYKIKAITHTRTQFSYEIEQTPLSLGMKLSFKLMPKSAINAQTMKHIELIESLIAKEEY